VIEGSSPFLFRELTIMNYTSFFFFTPFLLLCSGCGHIPSTSYFSKTIHCMRTDKPAVFTETLPENPCQQRTITIWIHGTKAFFSKFLFKNFFYTRKGLHSALSFDPQYHLREIAELLYAADPQAYCIEDLYFFGWSGKLSFKARHKAGKQLYIQLCALVKQYEEKYGVKPCIRIITHSHGGNVALNMACFNNELNLIIDELILMACPVQDRTCPLTAHETFKKIYSLYSRFDSIQVMDPQLIYYLLKKDFTEIPIKPNSFFSKRDFPPLEKMIQVQLKLNTRGIMHLEFIANKFVGLLPMIINEINQHADSITPSSINVITIKFT
jgi:hypothetical protein